MVFIYVYIWGFRGLQLQKQHEFPHFIWRRLLFWKQYQEVNLLTTPLLGINRRLDCLFMSADNILIYFLSFFSRHARI